MSILLVARNRDMNPFKEALLQQDPNLEVEIWPDVQHKSRINFAVAWNQPKNIFESYPNLKVISSLGAGVNHLLADESIPDHIVLTRIVAPSLKTQMSDYVMTGVFNILRKTHLYYKQQLSGTWKALSSVNKTDITVGVMGLGALGKQVAADLNAAGFHVKGWSRSLKSLEGIETYSEQELGEFLNKTQVAVCLLPLTPETSDILNLELFKKLRKPAHIINAGRGDHLVDEDVIYALDAGILESATLDVFRTEPLPDSHPFWGRNNIVLTPHIASVSNPDEIAGLIVENYKRMSSGMELMYSIDSKKGY